MCLDPCVVVPAQLRSFPVSDRQRDVRGATSCDDSQPRLSGHPKSASRPIRFEHCWKGSFPLRWSGRARNPSENQSLEAAEPERGKQQHRSVSLPVCVAFSAKRCQAAKGSRANLRVHLQMRLFLASFQTNDFGIQRKTFDINCHLLNETPMHRNYNLVKSDPQGKAVSLHLN